MENKTIVVWAGLRVKDGCDEAFKKEAAIVIAATRNEKGCMRYDLLQDTEDKCSFFFFEEYVDASAYASHRAQDYMTAFRKKREELLDKYLGLRTFGDVQV